MIETYLLGRPSRSFTLRHLGEAFAEFIEISPLPDETRRSWLGSVAKIEYAFMECFESAQSALPEANDLANAVIELQEHVKLLNLTVPADLCWQWEEFFAIEPQSVDVAVWREPPGRSRQERLDPAEVPLLVRLKLGIRLDVLFDSLPEPKPSEEEITRWFAK